MSKFSNRTCARLFVCLLIAAGFSVCGFAQQTPVFTPGNLVVVVEGCGVYGGTCTSVTNGTGTGTGNSSDGGYGDNQGTPLTLFQYAPNGTSSVNYVNSFVLPQTASGANVQVSGEYGSSSEGTIQLSGDGNYLTLMGYGIDAVSFNANPTNYGTYLNPKGSANYGALGQTGSLTLSNQTLGSPYPGGYTPVPRVLALIDANGNVNTSTALYNVFDFNNPRSAYTANGSTFYASGQGSGTDSTGGVFYSPVGTINNSPTAITGLDTCASTCTEQPAQLTIGQDTRTVQIYNGTLYVSVDSTEGKSNNRSFIGTLGTPPSSSLFTPPSQSSGYTTGPAQISGLGNSGGTGKVTITTGASTNGNTLNNSTTKVNGAALDAINLSPSTFFFASSSVLYVADSGNPKNNSNGENNSNDTANIGDGGLQKWVNSSSDGSGTWSLKYTLYQGLNLVNNGGTSGTTGLYALTGYVSGASVYLYATNATLSDLDTTYLFGITDTLSNTTPPNTSEAFSVLDTAPADSNFKGVSFTPAIPDGDVEITSVPSGLAFTSAGTGCAPGTYTTPVSLAWTPGSNCQLSVVSSQTASGNQYVFSQWQDGNTGTTESVTAPSTTAVYTANFNQAYLLTTSAGTGGTVSAGGYYAAGTNATVTAIPAAGYSFVNFTGSVTSTSNPITVLMNGAQSITANFAQNQAATITLSNTTQTYSGSPEGVTVTTSPSGLAYTASYTGTTTGYGPSTTPPTNPDTYNVVVTITDPNYSGIQNGTLTISQADPTVTLALLSGQPATTPVGTTVYFDLSSATAPQCPTGTAQLWVDGSASGSAVTLTSTTCNQPIQFSLATLAAGAHSIYVAYSGDADFIPENTTALNYTVASAAATVTLAASSTSINAGQSVTFTATIAPASPSNDQAPTGTVAFFDGSTPIGSGSTLTGTSPYTSTLTTTLAAGSHRITASYTDANGNLIGSSSPVNVAEVTLIVPTISWTPSPTEFPYGAALGSGQLSASAVDSSNAPISGSFTFSEASGTILGAGTVNLTANFTPTDPNTYASNSATVTLLIDQAVPTVTAWPTASAISSGQTLASSALTGGTASVQGSFAFTTPSTIPPDGTTSQSVTFIPSDSTDYASVTGMVSVTVNEPGVSLSSSSLSFGSESVGSSTAPQSVMLTNTGSGTLTISSISVTGPDTSSFVFSNNCGSTLAASAFCTISGYFDPTTATALTATVTISDSASGSPQMIALSGTGTNTASAMTSPTSGSILNGPSVTFNWNTVSGATGYALWIGTTGVGSHDLLEGGVHTATSLTYNSLPTTGGTIYVRLFTSFNGTLLSNDYTYTETQPATMTSPTPLSTLTGSSANFIWTTANGATGYALWIGTTGVGSFDLLESGVHTATSLTYNSLPTTGGTIYVRLLTSFNGTLVSNDYTYAETQPATMTSPTPLSTLTGSSANFIWTTANGAAGYALWIGTTGVGSHDLLEGGIHNATSLTYNSLPTTGGTIYVRLYTNFNGVLLSNDYSYTETQPAALTSPTPMSTLTGPGATFAWTTANGAAGYALWIGTTGVGSHDLLQGAIHTATSLTYNSLPTTGGTVYVRLYTSFNGTLLSNDYTYTEAQLATLISPTPTSTLTGPSATFSWTTASGATGYALWIGTTGVGSHDLLQGGIHNATSLTYNSLPTTGGTVYVRLYTNLNGVLLSNDYTYTAAP